jgi:hypothetical protein
MRWRALPLSVALWGLCVVWLCLLSAVLPSFSSSSSSSSSSFPSPLLFVSGASWASPSATIVDGPLLSVQSLNVSGALHVGTMNVAKRLAAMQAQIEELSALLTALSGRMTAAETAATAQATTISGHATRLAAAENLNGTATPLTTTVQSMRDLHAGLPVTDAVLGLRALFLTPVSVNATAGSNAAEVRWSMARTVVTAEPGGQQCSADGIGGGNNACTVNGLTNGQAYTFTAVVSNLAGAGERSAPSNIVVPALVCSLLSSVTDTLLHSRPLLESIPPLGCTVSAQWPRSTQCPLLSPCGQ